MSFSPIRRKRRHGINSAQQPLTKVLDLDLDLVLLEAIHLEEPGIHLVEVEVEGLGPTSTSRIYSGALREVDDELDKEGAVIHSFRKRSWLERASKCRLVYLSWRLQKEPARPLPLLPSLPVRHVLEAD
jgi:hypothetical protein